MIVDLGSSKIIKALGLYHPIFNIAKLKADNVNLSDAVAQYAADFMISVSTDGRDFKKCLDGVFRSFSGEEVLRFDPCEARYIKLEIFSTTGKRTCIPEFENAPLAIAEISVFE